MCTVSCDKKSSSHKIFARTVFVRACLLSIQLIYVLRFIKWIQYYYDIDKLNVLHVGGKISSTSLALLIGFIFSYRFYSYKPNPIFINTFAYETSICLFFFTIYNFQSALGKHSYNSIFFLHSRFSFTHTCRDSPDPQ